MNDVLLGKLPAGPYHPKELRYMEKLVSMVAELDGDCLEVGCLAGRSSIVIGLGAKESGSWLFCIDIWDSGEWDVMVKEADIPRERYLARPENISTVFRDNIKKFGLQGMVIPIMDRSEHVLKGWSKPLKFVHIDGCHEYEFVKKDIEWKNHIVEGGIICFHDYSRSWTEVKRAIYESFDTDTAFESVGLAISLIAFRRIAL